MQPTKKTIWALGIFMLISGVLLHFTFDWSGSLPLVGLFSPVNESIWEHKKLIFFPFSIGVFIQYKQSGHRVSIPGSAAIALLIGLCSISLLYYTYTGALGVRADWFNIAIFVISVILTCVTYYRLMGKTFPSRIPLYISFGIFFLLMLLFIVFTFFPPKIPLFADPQTGTFGYFETVN